MKRNRLDGQLSKQEYEQEDNDDSHQGSFTKATPNTLASRKFVSVQREDKKTEFIRHISALNSSMLKWFKEQVASNPNVPLVAGAQDYLDFSTQLEDRYLRKFGEVLTFGSGDCGQLAHGVDRDEDMMVRFPRIVFSLRDKQVVGISCGGLHNAVYTSMGAVYTWGCADDGSLGRPGDESTPLLVSTLSDQCIIGVACGDGQTIAVSASGEVFGWGCYKDKEGKKWFNPSEQAAVPAKDIKKQQDTPLRIANLPHNVVEVCCGSAFCLARCSDSTVYSWGIGECGELGREVPPLKKPAEKGDDEGPQYDIPNILKHHITPGKMYFTENPSQSVKNAKSIGCGSYHSFVIVVGGEVYSCGLNNYSQLGLGDTTSRPLLTEVTALSGLGVKLAVGGMHHSLVLTSTGKMLSFGRSDSGQIGIKNTEEDDKAGGFVSTPTEPALSLPSSSSVRVVNIACGGNHSLALTSQNEVYSWGYGDMLALGHGEEKDEPVPKKLNFTKAKLTGKITVRQVAGGGQHSAIIGEVVGTA